MSRHDITSRTITLTLTLTLNPNLQILPYPRRRRVLPSSAEQREASQLYGAVVDETFPHGTLDAKFWNYPGVTGLKIRGPNYLQVRSLKAICCSTVRYYRSNPIADIVSAVDCLFLPYNSPIVNRS